MTLTPLTGDEMPPPYPAVLNVDRLETKFGKDIIAALHATNVLTQAGDGERYPCDWGGRACNREVFLNHRPGSENPHFAFCRTWGGGGCPNLNLPSEKIRVSELVCDRLLILIRNLLELPRTPAIPVGKVSSAWHLGKRRFDGREKNVIALLHPDPCRLASSLAELGAQPEPSFVVLFTSDFVSTEVERRHLPGAAVELVFLEHHLRYEFGELRWRHAQTFERVAAPTDDEILALAFHDGRREEVTRERYAKLIADPEEQWDLLIDLKGGVGRCCRAGSRPPGGRFVEVGQMKLEEGAKLGELIRCAPEARRASVLYTDGSAAQRWVQRARKTIDHQLAPKLWSFFQSVGGAKNNQQFAFRPHAGCRYLLIVPLGTEHQATERPGV